MMQLKKVNRNNLINLLPECKTTNTFYNIHYRGVVISNKTNKVLKPGRGGNGYLTVALNGKSKYIHRLVAEAFIPNPGKYKCINHKDGNKLNNHYSNLEWCTSSENNSHAIRTGLKRHKTKAKPVIKYDLDMNEIKRYKSIRSVPNAHSTSISKVCKGKLESHKGFIYKYQN